MHLFKVSIGMTDFEEICCEITGLTLHRVCNIMGTLGGIYVNIYVKASNVTFAQLNLLQTFINRTCRLLVLKNL